MRCFYNSIFCTPGLDIPKHGEPAYPLDSYGDGWSTETPPEAPKLPFIHKSNSQVNLAGVENGHTPSANPKGNVVGVENPAVSADTAF